MRRNKLKKVLDIGSGTLTFYTNDEGETKEVSELSEPKPKKKKRRMTPQEENSRKTIPQSEQLRMAFDYTME